MSDRFRKILALTLVLALSATLVAGCAQDGGDDGGSDGGTSEEPVSGGTMNYYLNEPAFIDPLNVQESQGTEVAQGLFDSLVDFDGKTSELVPAAAESWEPNEDASVWTFKLRQGAKFHNGRDVTAADFKYAWERICNPANQSEISYHLGAVKGFDEMQAGSATELAGVKVVDDLTLEVTLAYPFADFEYVVGHPALGPVPKEEVDKDPKAFADMPIGNGPFKMTEPWKHDQYIKVARFDDYYGDKTLLDGVNFQIIKDEETAFLEFKAGNIDFTTIPSGQIQSTIAEYGESEDGLAAEPGKQTLLGPELATYYIVLNTKDKTLANADVRRALSLAIDRETISKTVYEDTRQPATGIVTDGVAGYKADQWPYVTYDVEQAKELLAKAGFPNGQGMPELSIAFNTGAGHEDVMQIVQQNLKDIGVNAKLDGQEWAQVLDSYDAGTFQLGRLGWIADYPIMDNFLYPLFISDSADNHSFYNNPEVDAALKEARTMTDTDARLAKYAEIEKTIGEDAPVIPIVNYRHRHVASERMRDLVYSPTGLTQWTKVWIAGGGEGETGGSTETTGN